MALKQELPSDIVNTPIRKRVTDLDHAGGDTGAMQVFASLRDGNVVLDGPVGCHVLPAVAVTLAFSITLPLTVSAPPSGRSML